MKLKGLVRLEATAAARAMAILAKSANHGAKFFADLEGMSTQMDPPLREKALLVIGEYGSMEDLKNNKKLVATVLAGFSDSTTRCQKAAGIAYANICIGNPTHFVPELLKMINNPGSVSVALYIEVVI